MTTETTRDFYDYNDSHFGGLIYQSDFYTNHPESHNIASRIAKDWKFDRNCRKNEEARNKRMMEDIKNCEEIDLYKNK